MVATALMRWSAFAARDGVPAAVAYADHAYAVRVDGQEEGGGVGDGGPNVGDPGRGGLRGIVGSRRFRLGGRRCRRGW